MQRVHIASMRNTPRARAVSTRLSEEATSSVNGFSVSVALPAARDSIVASKCAVCGVAT